ARYFAAWKPGFGSAACTPQTRLIHMPGIIHITSERPGFHIRAGKSAEHLPGQIRHERRKGLGRAFWFWQRDMRNQSLRYPVLEGDIAIKLIGARRKRGHFKSKFVVVLPSGMEVREHIQIRFTHQKQM